MIWVFPLHFTSIKKNTESSVIFLQNGVLILDWKEYKEADAICFEIRISTKKTKEFLRKVPSKIYGSYLIMEKNKNNFWFVNNLEYHHRESGLMSNFSGFPRIYELYFLDVINCRFLTTETNTKALYIFHCF